MQTDGPASCGNEVSTDQTWQAASKQVAAEETGQAAGREPARSPPGRQAGDRPGGMSGPISRAEPGRLVEEGPHVKDGRPEKERLSYLKEEVRGIPSQLGEEGKGPTEQGIMPQHIEMEIDREQQQNLEPLQHVYESLPEVILET